MRSLCLLLFAPLVVVGQDCTPDGRCDKHERCSVWKADGECIRNADYMKTHCPASCHQTSSSSSSGACEDHHEHCPQWADLGECQANSYQMLKHCAKSCGHCGTQTVEAATPETGTTQDDNDDKESLIAASKAFGEPQSIEGSQADDTKEILRKSLDYMNSKTVHDLPKSITNTCQNRHHHCSFWAGIGECEKNKAYMQTNCAPACRSCHLIDMEARCPKKPDLEPALQPGDLNRMFQRILKTANDTDVGYTIHIHSQPDLDGSSTEISAALDKSLAPWIITLDDFLTPEECEAMIQLGYDFEYKRSEDVGEKKFDGSHGSVKSERRTSENAWCSSFHGCRQKEVPTRLHERMSRVMGIPADNSEDLQLLKYEVGQFYRTHHDFIPHQVERQCGPRILTFFLYLNDVDAGGGTNFPQLNITVQPKRGRALLWPSVLNSDPNKQDSRTYHQALEVEAGTKFAANGWIHLFDYQTPQALGCT